jgi:hypothetical protein
MMTATGVLDLWRGTAQEFDESLGSSPLDTCTQIQDTAVRIESAIKVVYRVTALEARSIDDMQMVSELWGNMAQICRDAVKRLTSMGDKNRDCGVGVYVDRILDLANKCQRLQEMHRSP